MTKKSNVVFRTFDRSKNIAKIEKDIRANSDNVDNFSRLIVEFNSRIEDSPIGVNDKLKLSFNYKMNMTAKSESIPMTHVTSINLLSGVTCPAAGECFAYAKKDRNSLNLTGTTLIKTCGGGYCYSVAEENQYRDAYNSRLYNTRLLKKYNNDIVGMAILIYRTIMARYKIEIVRIHSAGGMMSTKYYLSWILAGHMLESHGIQVFGYSKVLPYLTSNGQFRSLWSDNFKIQYSFGGLFDGDLQYDEDGIPTTPTCFVRLEDGQYENLPTVCITHEDTADFNLIMAEKTFVLPLH